MADTTALKNRIRAAIKANDNQEITGPVLQQSLLDIVDELNGATETEASQRQSGDSTLQQGINTERQARIDADNALGQRITQETQRAQEAEQTANTKASKALSEITSLEIEDVTGSVAQATEMSIALRTNKGSQEDPEIVTLDTLVIPAASKDKAGLMSGENKRFMNPAVFTDDTFLNRVFLNIFCSVQQALGIAIVKESASRIKIALYNSASVFTHDTQIHQVIIQADTIKYAKFEFSDGILEMYLDLQSYISTNSGVVSGALTNFCRNRNNCIYLRLLDEIQHAQEAQLDISDLQKNCTKIAFSDNKNVNYFLPNIYTSVQGAVSIGFTQNSSGVLAIALYNSMETSFMHQIARIDIQESDIKDGIYSNREGTFKVFLNHSSDIVRGTFYQGATLSSIYLHSLQFLINILDIESSLPYSIGNETLLLSNTNVSGSTSNSDVYIYKVNVPNIFGLTTVKYRSVGANRIGILVAGKNQNDEHPTIIRDYGIFEVATSGETVITLNNQTGLEKSQFNEWFIGIKHYGQNYNYYTSSTNGWRYRGDEWTNNSGVLFDADFYIGVPIPANLNSKLEEIHGDLDNLDTRVTSLEEGQSSEGGEIEAILRYDYMSLYKTTDFTEWLNWKAGSQQATDWTIDSSGAATPTSHSTFESKARNGVLYLNKRYQSAWKKAVFDVLLYTDTVLDIHFARNQSTGGAPNESLYQIDCANSVLNVMALSNRDVTYTVSKSKALDFTIVNGRKYRCEISMEDVSFKFALTDMVTAETTILTFSNTWAAGTQKDIYGFGWKAGSVAPTITYFEIFEPRNPLVCFLGDSITEGFGMTSDIKNKFASVAIRSLLKNSIICAACSDTIPSVMTAISDELSIIKPKYAIITIGTNDGESVTSDRYVAIKTALENIGCIPIFNHIPASSYAGHSPIIINGKIDDAGVFNGAYLDVATSIDNNPASGPNTSMFADGIHPNKYGTLAILSRFMSDIQFLFNPDLISKYWENNNA